MVADSYLPQDSMNITAKFLSDHIGGINGICHAGAHSGQEVSDYINAGVNNIVWIEANYKIFNSLIKNTCKYGINQNWYCECLWDQDNVVKKFNLSNNGEESSSVMEFGDGHKMTNPHIGFTDYTILLTKRMDTLVKTQKDFDWKDINMIVTDCQGADLRVLHGFGDLLWQKNIKIIKSEVELNKQYEGESTHEKIDAYLSKFGFVFTFYFHTASGWGDHYWIRN